MPQPDLTASTVDPAAPDELLGEVGRDGRTRYAVLASVCALAWIAYLHRVGFATAVTDLKGPTGLTDRGVSHLMAAFMLAYGLVEIPIGALGDRLGARHLLAVLVVGWSLLTGAIGLVLFLPAGTAWPLVYLLVLRALFGAFQGGMFPLTSRMLTDWMPVGERGTAQGLLWTSSRVGGALSSLVVFYLFRAVGLGQAAFWLLASVGFVWCAWFWPWFRNRPEEMAGVSAAELKAIRAGRPATEPGGGGGHHAIPWGLLLGSRSAWCLCLTYGALAFSGNFFITLLPTYLKGHRHLSAEVTSWISAVPLACGVVGCLLGGALSDRIIRRTGSRRWGRRLVAATGLALGAAALAATLLVSEPGWLALLLGLAFFGNDLAMSPSWAACADIGERSAGTLGGAMNMTGSVTGALGAVLAGHFLDRGQDVTLFLVLAASYLLGSLLWMGVDASRTLGDAPEGA